MTPLEEELRNTSNFTYVCFEHYERITMFSGDKKRSTYKSSYVAGYNADAATISHGSIVIDTVNFKRHPSDKSRIARDKQHCRRRHDAAFNLIDTFIEDRRCEFVVVLLADSLAAKRAKDRDVATYQAASRRYVDKYRGKYSNLSISEDRILYTGWDAWLDNSAIEQLCRAIPIKGESSTDPVSYVENKKPSTLADFKAVFDQSNLLPDERNVEQLAPSLTVARAYLEYLYKSGSTLFNGEFKKLVDEIQSLDSTKRQCLFEEAAQHFVAGILARKLNRTFVFLHQRTNNIYRFIESVLIGKNHHGKMAIQSVDVRFIKTEKQEARNFVESQPSFYSSTTWSILGNVTKSIIDVEGGEFVSVPLNRIVIESLEYLRDSDTPLNLLSLLLKAVKTAISMRAKIIFVSPEYKDNNVSTPLFRISSETPDPSEALLHLLIYVSSLESRRDFLIPLQAELKKVAAVRLGKDRKSRPYHFNTTYFATFNAKKFDIPDGAILSDGVCFSKRNAKVIEAGKHNTGEILRASLNTVNGLIKRNGCEFFLLLVPDTLAPKNTGDLNVVPYQTAGEKYLADYSRYFTAVSLNKDNIIFTRWDQWHSNHAINLILNRMFNRSVERNALSTLADFKVVFDDITVKPEHRKINTLSPSIEVALAYLTYLYESETSPYNHFRNLADKIIDDFSKSEIQSLRRKQTVSADDIKRIKYNKQVYLFEEAAQYFVMAIIARILQKPIRILHAGTNDVFTFIENELVGKLPGGELAIRMVIMQFEKRNHTAKFFKDNPDFYNPRTTPKSINANNNGVIHLKGNAHSITIPSFILDVLFDDVLYDESTPINLLIMAYEELMNIYKCRISEERNLEGYHLAEQYYKVSSINHPEPAEIIFHYISFFSLAALSRSYLVGTLIKIERLLDERGLSDNTCQSNAKMMP